jgi:hypothetical protein
LECPSWLPAATANTNAQVIIDRLATHRESAVHQENSLIPQSIWENCRPSISRVFGRNIQPVNDSDVVQDWVDWADAYALVCNERVPVFSGEGRHAINAPSKKLSHLQKMCIIRLMRKEGIPSSQLHRDYVFSATHSIHSELCMILQTRYFVLLDVNFTIAAEVSRDAVVEEISYEEYRARTTPWSTAGMLYNPSKFVTAHEVAFAPKGEHCANVSIWFDTLPIKLEQSQIKRSRRLKQKKKAQIRNEHTYPNANGALISRTSSADFPTSPPDIEPFVPMLPAENDNESQNLIMAIIEHRIDSMILQNCSFVNYEQVQELLAREMQLAKTFEAMNMFHEKWTWPKREGMGHVTISTKAPPGNIMPYIPLKNSMISPCVHIWSSFVKAIGDLNVDDGTSKRLSVFRSIDGSIPRTSFGGSAKLPHIFSNASAKASSTKNDATWKEILLGVPENGRWETALRLHDKKRDGSFDHTTIRNMPLSTIPFVQT